MHSTHPLNPTASNRERKKKGSPTGGGCQKPTPSYRRYKPYEEGKKEASQPKKPPEEAAVFDVSYARFRWNPPRLILPHSGKGDKHDKNLRKTQSIFSSSTAASSLSIGSALIWPLSSPPPWRRWRPRTNASPPPGRCPRCRLWGPLHHRTLPGKTTPRLDSWNLLAFCCNLVPLFLVFLDRRLNHVLFLYWFGGIWLRRRSQYLEELLQEQQKLGPFVQVLPICGRLLNQGEDDSAL